MALNAVGDKVSTQWYRGIGSTAGMFRGNESAAIEGAYRRGKGTTSLFLLGKSVNFEYKLAFIRKSDAEFLKVLGERKKLLERQKEEVKTFLFDRRGRTMDSRFHDEIKKNFGEEYSTLVGSMSGIVVTGVVQGIANAVDSQIIEANKIKWHSAMKEIEAVLKDVKWEFPLHMLGRELCHKETASLRDFGFIEINLNEVVAAFRPEIYSDAEEDDRGSAKTTVVNLADVMGGRDCSAMTGFSGSETRLLKLPEKPRRAKDLGTETRIIDAREFRAAQTKRYNQPVPAAQASLPIDTRAETRVLKVPGAARPVFSDFAKMHKGWFWRVRQIFGGKKD